MLQPHFLGWSPRSNRRPRARSSSFLTSFFPLIIVLITHHLANAEDVVADTLPCTRALIHQLPSCGDVPASHLAMAQHPIAYEFESVFELQVAQAEWIPHHDTTYLALPKQHIIAAINNVQATLAQGGGARLALFPVIGFPNAGGYVQVTNGLNSARLNSPSGFVQMSMAAFGSPIPQVALLVADTENHVIRAFRVSEGKLSFDLAGSTSTTSSLDG
jgi:hypothetical protein